MCTILHPFADKTSLDIRGKPEPGSRVTPPVRRNYAAPCRARAQVTRGVGPARLGPPWVAFDCRQQRERCRWVGPTWPEACKRSRSGTGSAPPRLRLDRARLSQRRGRCRPLTPGPDIRWRRWRRKSRATLPLNSPVAELRTDHEPVSDPRQAPSLAA